MVKLFTGTSNPQLGQDVGNLLGLPVSKSEVVRFDNSEVRVRIEDDVKDHTCILIQPTSNPSDTNLMELFFFCDALRRQEAKRVLGVVPYFGYGRQDIQHREGECVSANVVIRFMEAIGFDKIYTFDLHDEATGGVFHIPFRNISALPTLVHAIQDYIKEQNMSYEDIVIVSPDQGGIERAREFGTIFFGHADFPLAVTEKKRDADRMHQSKAVDLYGNVKDKAAIIVDDVATSAGSLVHAAEMVMQTGATKVLGVITHHDFSEHAPERVKNSSLEILFATDTIALTEYYTFPKLQIVSIAPVIAQELAYLCKK